MRKGQASWMLRIIIGVLISIAALFLTYYIMGYIAKGNNGGGTPSIPLTTLVFALRNIRLRRHN